MFSHVGEGELTPRQPGHHTWATNFIPNLEQFEQFLHDLPFELSGQEAPGAIGSDNVATSGSSAALAGAMPGEGGEGGKLKINIPKRRPTIKVGRNEPCPCGSGKKYKHCHMKQDRGVR